MIKIDRNAHSSSNDVPLIIVKAIESVFGPESKREIITRLTDALVSVEGEGMRKSSWVLIEETNSGDWSAAGKSAVEAVINRDGSPLG